LYNNQEIFEYLPRGGDEDNRSILIKVFLHIFPFLFMRNDKKWRNIPVILKILSVTFIPGNDKKPAKNYTRELTY